MTNWMMLLGLALAGLSLVFIDGRPRWVSLLGVAMLFIGLGGVVTSAVLMSDASQREAAKCASRGGVPSGGDCYINGRRE